MGGYYVLISLSYNNCSLDLFPPKNAISYAFSQCVENSRSEKSFCHSYPKLWNQETGTEDDNWLGIYILITYEGNKVFSSFNLESNIALGFPGEKRTNQLT